MSRNQRQLKKELQQAGAKPAEIAELAAIASSLQQLGPTEAESPSKAWILKVLTGGAVGLAMGAFLVVAAQPVLPTSWLYPVQKTSDSVAIRLRPSYRASVMMKRAQQVDAMVASHTASGKILATLGDYKDIATTYKSIPRADYAAFEFCKHSLEQAAPRATPEVRQAIQNNLQWLQTI